ncbi:hypothetical protein OG203_12995 [Nocardia sp. NBC_01499]|uniref:hypothetical protein n=1 Tax=Nocardia sp. NBC_01499 TaxID=2903597 RepID=UPI00386A3AB1
MAAVDELLAELRAHLRAAVSYTTASMPNDVYEGFLFSLVIATARKSGAQIRYQDVNGSMASNLVFRTSPGWLYSTARNYTHAVLEFGRAPELEVHIGVKVQGNSGVEHECDVVVLDAEEADLCRFARTSPRASKCLLVIECKYYTGHLPLGQARGFAGLSADLGRRAHPIFVANTGSGSVTKYLTGRTLSRELHVVPRASEVEGVQSLIREAFKDHVGRRDSGLRVY